MGQSGIAPLMGSLFAVVTGNGVAYVSQVCVPHQRAALRGITRRMLESRAQPNHGIGRPSCQIHLLQCEICRTMRVPVCAWREPAVIRHLKYVVDEEIFDCITHLRPNFVSTPTTANTASWCVAVGQQFLGVPPVMSRMHTCLSRVVLFAGRGVGTDVTLAQT